jgi:hypothetical protein
MNQNSESKRKTALGKLRKIYDDEFGKTPFRRNVISLFLYGGPMSAARSFTGLSPTACLPWCAHPFFWHYCDRHNLQWLQQSSDSQRVGFLMTGDGYLDTPERLKALLKYFEPYGRLAKVSALQVMHHGSKNNWHQGVASAISPDYSVFCSDPSHKKFGHPNRDVVEDFTCYNPQQVDRRRGLSLSALIKM